MKLSFPTLMLRLMLLVTIIASVVVGHAQQPKPGPTPPATTEESQSEKIFIRRVRRAVAVARTMTRTGHPSRPIGDGGAKRQISSWLVRGMRIRIVEQP